MYTRFREPSHTSFHQSVAVLNVPSESLVLLCMSLLHLLPQTVQILPDLVARHSGTTT